MKIRIVVIAAMLAGTLHASANWGGSAGGSVGTGSFKPFGMAQVEMQSEDLSILLYHDHAKVRVQYVLKNTGDAVDVKAGFPCLGARMEKKDFHEVEDYRLTVNGQAAPYRTERGALGNWKTLFDEDYKRGIWEEPETESATALDPSVCAECRIWWLTSTVHFDKDATQQVTIEYESNYEYSDGGYSDDADYSSDTFRYLLSTAAAWKGPIQKGALGENLVKASFCGDFEIL